MNSSLQCYLHVLMIYTLTNHPHICYINFHWFSVGSQTPVCTVCMCVKNIPKVDVCVCVCLKWEQKPLGGLRTVNTAPVGLCSTVVLNLKRAYFTHLISNHVKQGLLEVRLNDPSQYATTSANPTAEERIMGNLGSVRVLHFHFIRNGSELLSYTTVSACLI